MVHLAIRDLQCFNPHTHTGCDLKNLNALWQVSVSIHTPIQGVTIFTIGRADVCAVSIHTPIQGVTSRTLSSFNAVCRFNPHTHTGCDRYHFQVLFASICFNPHTHTGCDIGYSRKVTSHTSFNPHTHTGCDDKADVTDDQILVSIHTPIQGVTRCRTSIILLLFCFNPHTHTGCDSVSCGPSHGPLGFNPHTHTGCDSQPALRLSHDGRFQSTHPYRV